MSDGLIQERVSFVWHFVCYFILTIKGKDYKINFKNFKMNVMQILPAWLATSLQTSLCHSECLTYSKVATSLDMHHLENLCIFFVFFCMKTKTILKLKINFLRVIFLTNFYDVMLNISRQHVLANIWADEQAWGFPFLYSW